MTNRNTIIEIAFSNHADAELMYGAIEQLVYDFGQLGTLSMREAEVTPTADETLAKKISSLYQLPNGDWIMLAYVKQIVALDASDDLKILPRVVVVSQLRSDGLELHSVIFFDNITQAREVRDRIAADHNALVQP